MAEWWQNLDTLSRFFFSAALFFSVFFLWQVFASFGGVGDGAESGDGGDMDVSGHDVDTGGGGHGSHDGVYDHFEHGAQHDAVESVASFKIISLRSLITFFTLFCWSNALFLSVHTPVILSMVYSLLWGIAGMLGVAWVFYALIRLSESGTSDIGTCIGEVGTVYQDIPSGGMGRVRATVSGAISHVKAVASSAEALPSGTRVRIVRKLDSTLVQVERAE